MKHEFSILNYSDADKSKPERKDLSPDRDRVGRNPSARASDLG
jgi:hypothetical protein